jgi:formate/nitrite transporter FocA (FNT family)
MMKKITRHLIIPVVVTVLFFAVAAGVALAAGVLGIVAAVKALKDKMRGEANSSLRMASALIFAIPAIYIVLIES